MRRRGLDGRVPCTDKAYICHKCDELFFERKVLSVCGKCKRIYNKATELVSFKDYCWASELAEIVSAGSVKMIKFILLKNSYCVECRKTILHEYGRNLKLDKMSSSVSTATH